MLEDAFPALTRGGYRVTSAASQLYNCIAWAANDISHWWWPVSGGRVNHWPDGVDREETLAAFEAAFATLGYQICAGGEWDPRFEKIALFTDANGVPTHAARQVETGRWTSKLGELQDIDHQLGDLEGAIYGSVARIMMRSR